MTEARKLAAILAADVVGYSRLAGRDEEGTLARLRALRGDVLDPSVAAHRGRVVKRTGDGFIGEFRSAVDAVRCAVELQNAMAERNAGLPEGSRMVFRVGVHVGDVIEEADGDLMGDGVNIAARLEGICEPGGVCLSAAAYEHARDRVKESFADLGERQLKNIARPVRVYAFNAGETASAASAGPGPPAPNHSEPPRLSLVVLPFANIGDDPSQEYFVDGVTGGVTTDLSHIAGAFVIARGTAFTFKGKPVDVKTIGRDLNVRYVVQGSVQRAGNRMRVNVQLVDANSGSHLWAEQFDRLVADFFETQDEIVVRIAGQLNASLIVAEARRAAKSSDPDAFDLYLQGVAWLIKGPFPICLQRARSFFARALGD